jgi:hypothetical protein
MHKFGESRTTRIIMATAPHVTSGSGLRKFQVAGFLLNRGHGFLLQALQSKFSRMRSIASSFNLKCLSFP